MPVGFSLTTEGALLVGGPEAGQVVRVRRGEDQVVVLEEVEATWAPEGADPFAPVPRQGVYRRQGTSSNFYWKGWV